MKTSFLIASVCAAVLLSGCGSSKKITDQLDTPISTQKLATTFKRQGIKIEWDWSITNWKGDFKSIEVTGYATSNGNTENNREEAFKVAELEAKAKLRRFLNEDITTENTVSVLSKNIEKAKDRIQAKTSNSDTVAINDDEPLNGNSYSRENSNDVARTVTRTIKNQASGILKGIYVADEEIVDRQTVKVTIRWDQRSDQAQRILRKKFGG